MHTKMHAISKDRTLESLLNGAPGIVVAIDSRDFIVFGNEKFHSLDTKHSPRVGFLIEDQQLNQEVLLELCRQARTTGKILSKEMVTQDSWGQAVWYQCDASPVFAEDETSVASVASCLDITLRKRLEERNVQRELREREAYREACSRLSLIYNSSSDLMALVEVVFQGDEGRSYKLMSSNDSWLKASQRDPADMFGKSLKDLLTSREYEAVRSRYEQAIETRSPVIWEDSYHQPTGLLSLETIATPIFNSDHVCTHVLAVSRDISSGKKSFHRQEFLSKVAGTLLTSLDFSSTVKAVLQLVVPEFSSFCSVQILSKDRALEYQEVMFSQSNARTVHLEKLMRERPLLDLKDLGAASRVCRTSKAEVYSGVTLSNLKEIFPGEGFAEALAEMNLTSVLFVPLLLHDQTLGVVEFFQVGPGTSYSIDDLHFAEELCFRTALAIDNTLLYNKVREAVQVRDDFMAVASHELKTPLCPLKMQIQLALTFLRKDIITSTKSEEIIKLLNSSDRQIDRLTQLIEDLLDVSQVSAGSMILHFEKFDIAELVREIAMRMHPELERSRCKFELQSSAMVVGEWDRIRIEQVILNLLKNSMKYGEGNPIVVKVSTKAVEKEGVFQEFVVLSIQDFGIGIGKLDQERIFGRFERAVSFRSFGGLGMGLYLSRQIIDAHGGLIRVESELAQGATFIIELPLQRKPT